jgi:hypothetical protein
MKVRADYEERMYLSEHPFGTINLPLVVVPPNPECAIFFQRKLSIIATGSMIYSA